MDVLIFIHPESDEFLRGTCDMVQFAEDRLEFADKGGPCCNSCSSIPLLNILPEMPLGGAGEMLNHIDNSSPVCSVSMRFSVKN